MFEKIYRISLLVLVASILAVQGLALRNDINRAAQEAARAAQESIRAQECQETLDEISTELYPMVGDYYASVYEDTAVDTIYEQQLISSEYTFMTQHAIAAILVACR